MTASPRIPRVELARPDIRHLERGNTGIDYVTSIEGAAPGTHLLVMALIHGNEISGAIAICRLLESGIAIARGRLTLALANTAAFATFDPTNPTASRFLDEDMNRLWGTDKLTAPGLTIEKRRALELLPVVESADMLLDLHSMQSFSPALTLCGLTSKGRRMALSLGQPAYVVADAGHASGKRLIDHGTFADEQSPRTAILLEAGQHWASGTADMAYACLLHALRTANIADAETIAPHLPPLATPAQRLIEVTHAIRIEQTPFTFTRHLEGLEVIPKQGTTIATDGTNPITTPYDNCILVMPSRRLQPGQTAIRLGRWARRAG